MRRLLKRAKRYLPLRKKLKRMRCIKIVLFRWSRSRSLNLSDSWRLKKLTPRHDPKKKRMIWREEPLKCKVYDDKLITQTNLTTSRNSTYPNNNINWSKILRLTWLVNLTYPSHASYCPTFRIKCARWWSPEITRWPSIRWAEIVNWWSTWTTARRTFTSSYSSSIELHLYNSVTENFSRPTSIEGGPEPS